MSLDLRRITDNDRVRKLTNQNIQDAFKNKVIDGRYTRLRFDNVEVEDKNFSLAEQKNALLHNKDLNIGVKGTLILEDKNTGKQLSKKTLSLGKLPWRTDRGTYISKGTEYSVANQFRLKYGAYSRVKENGEIETHYNISPGTGRSFRILLEPRTGVFKLVIAQAQPYLYPILRFAGISDQMLSNYWGPEILKANKQMGGPQDVDKVYKKLAGYSLKPGLTTQDKAKEIVAFFENMRMDASVNGRTMKVPVNKVTVKLLLASTERLLKINREEEEQDDRDSLEFRQLHSAEDFFAERVIKDAGQTGRKLVKRLDKSKSLDKIMAGVYTRALSGFLTEDDKSATGEQLNPIEILEGTLKTTPLGEGGLSGQNVTESMTNVHPSHFGFLDPVRVPESEKAGLSLYITYGTLKGNDGNLHREVLDTKSGKIKHVSTENFHRFTIAFPGEWESNKPILKAMANKKVVHVPRKEVDYALLSATDMFTVTTNLVPMLHNAQGNRALMAAKTIPQALPIKDPEEPLVQPKVPGKNESFYDVFGKLTSAAVSPYTGEVVKVTEDYISIKDKKGETHRVDIYNNFPYNRKSVSGKTYVYIKRSGQIIKLYIEEYKFQEGDLTLSYCPTSKKSEWKPIIGFIKHENNKKLYQITFKSKRSVTVTEDHSLMTMGDNFELHPIVPKDCLVNKTASPLVFLHRDESISLDSGEYSEGVLVGLYLSEGHISKSQKNLINIACEPVERMHEINTLLTALGYSPHNRSKNVSFTSENLANYLRGNCGQGSSNKFISNEILNRSNTFLLGLVNGYMAGDGCLSSDSNKAIQVTGVSTSKKLRDDLVDVLSILGVFCSTFYRNINESNPNWNNAFGFRIISSHLAKLPRLFFFKDREEKYRSLLSQEYRSSIYENVPIPKSSRKELYSSLRNPSMYVYKTASLGKLAKNRFSKASGKPSLWANSDILWDTISSIEEVPNEEYVYDFSVKDSESFAVNGGILVHNTSIHQTPIVKVGDTVYKDQVVARSNYTDEKGTFAVGKNLKTGYISYKGYNYEDGVVISESAAKKMTSEHTYSYELEINPAVRTGKANFISYFPVTYTNELLEPIDKDGVIQKGSKVHHGDPLILAMTERAPTATDISLGKIHKIFKRIYNDASLTWDHHNEGEVIEVIKGSSFLKVIVKTHQPMEIGDKITGRHGNKGVVSKILPDDKMPKNKEGENFDVLLNPQGIITRINPSQIHETLLGKVAKKRGQRILVKNFHPGDSNEFVENELKSVGLKDTEEVYDPEDNQKLGDILSGYQYFLKSSATAEKSFKTRGVGPSYTTEEIPAKGMRVGFPLDINALMAHGARKVARDAITRKGQKNDEMWKALRSGEPLPPPKVPHIFDKFIATLKSAGINVRKTGDVFQAMPMTDKEVLELSKGEVQKDLFLRAQDYKAERGGLFDEAMTGGVLGKNWTHINTEVPLPNPAVEENIRILLDMTQAKMRDVLKGSAKLGDKSGGKAILDILKKMDLEKEIKSQKEVAMNSRKVSRDKAIKKLRVLYGLRDSGLTPADMMVSKIPVIPPIFRPITPSVSGPDIIADANILYKDFMRATNALKEVQSLGLPDEDDDLQKAKDYQYESLKKLYGWTKYPNSASEKNVKGFIHQIIGSSPKLGMFQAKVLKKRQDLTGRAVITPDPRLGIDEAGLPENMAWDLYAPFIMRKMVHRGYTPLQAEKFIKEKHDQAKRILEQEIQERPVIVNRAPTLHKFNTMALFPKLTQDKVLTLPPLIESGFNADHDGDAMQIHVPISDEAVEEAREKMLPSRNLYTGHRRRAYWVPQQEAVIGLYRATKPTQDKPIATFATKEEAINAYRSGKIAINDCIEVKEL